MAEKELGMLEVESVPETEEHISADSNQVLTQSETADIEKVERLLKLPLARIKSLIKLDPDVTLASIDAVVLIAKATVSSLVTLYQTSFFGVS